jgi:MinD-like ATPase involved in chromosome partitioning or flagellar assembly
MTSQSSPRGIIYTFYSFKGGVGRTMALANVSALLAQWGHSVLVVDWDLEAPGLERFYAYVKPDIDAHRDTTPGVLDLLKATANGNRLSWQDCLIDIGVPGASGRLALLSAGRSDNTYSTRLQGLNFSDLFERHGLGAYIEELRNEWSAEFNFVLIDSRTGVTDIGGICTVHLADVLVLLFTANESSTEGAKYIIERAREAQQRLPVDRRRLLAVPVPARDESRTEYDKATEWKERYVREFGELYRDWLPSGTTEHEAIDQLRIPYIPYWSFGERLPVLEEGTSDRTSLGHAYQILSRILAARLDWFEALKGETLAPPPTPRRELSSEWIEKHRRAAMDGLKAAGLSGFTEIIHYSPDSAISKSQPELLSAARQAQVPTSGWPIGVVLDNREEARPRPTADGILANIYLEHPLTRPSPIYDYWTLTNRGDFYTLMSLPEDDRKEAGQRSAVHFDTRILRATEALLHCANLYKVMGFEPNAHVELGIRYGGLRGRVLAAASRRRRLFGERRNVYEDEISIPTMTFTLAAIEAEIVPLVKKVCEPLFVIFDFEKFEDAVYEQIVTDFVQGRIT